MSGHVIHRWTSGVFILFMLLAAATSVHAQDTHPAQKMVVESTNKMLQVLRDEGDRIASDPAFLESTVEEIIVPNLDFNTMTKLAVGKYWRRATDTQKTDLVLSFKQLLLNTYTGALTEYKGGEVKFAPFRPESREDRAVIRSTFEQSGGSDVPVLYKLRDSEGWAIYDIEVNNISLVTSYRTAFSNEINQGGIDGLLATLKKRNGKS